MFKLNPNLCVTNARISPSGWTQNISDGQQTQRKIELLNKDTKRPTCEPSVNVFRYAARRRLDGRSAPVCVVCTTHSPHLYFPCLSDFYLTPVSQLSCLLCSCALYFPLSLFLLPSLPSLFLCASFLLSPPFHYSVLERLLTTKSYRPIKV